MLTTSLLAARGPKYHFTRLGASSPSSTSQKPQFLSTLQTIEQSKMPRKSKKDVDLEDLVDDEPPTIEPYTILGIDKSATADEIKKAYRMTALKHHPGMREHFSI